MNIVPVTERPNAAASRADEPKHDDQADAGDHQAPVDERHVDLTLVPSATCRRSG